MSANASIDVGPLVTMPKAAARTDALQDAERLNAEGVALRAKGETNEAVLCYRRALTIAPGAAAIWSNLGNALVDLKQFDQAILSIRRALMLEPNETRFRNNLLLALNAAGVACRRAKRFDEAIRHYETALGIESAHAAIWANLGNVLMDLSRGALAPSVDGVPDMERFEAKPENIKILERAIACHRRALALEPGRAQLRDGLAMALNAMGVVLRAKKQWARALACCREVAELAPNRAASWSNYGNVLKDIKHLDTAIVCHRRAVALDPATSGNHFNLAVALATATRSEEAIAVLDDGLTRKPGDPHLRWDRALNYLRRGDYAKGWIDYEARLETGALPPRNPPGTLWRGENYQGQRLLVISEQGFGDTIWASRYLPQIKARGGELIVECRKELLPLVASMGIADRVVPKADPLPEADWHVNVCSLPGLFAPDIQTISGNAYIKAPKPPSQALAAAMAQAGNKLKVGIVWSGSTTFKANHDRAAPLRQFVDALALPNVQLYSLQKGPPTRELQSLTGAPIIDLAPHLHDFTDAAVAVEALDLVIMTDSALAHLAGAMGRPVWVLLNYGAYWLWLTERGDSPWYESLRLFRAKVWNDWAGVFDAAAAALMDLSFEHLQRPSSPAARDEEQ